jgi:murein DD-endopeptidase MepM/ murein hydrolase activator NlpD
MERSRTRAHRTVLLVLLAVVCGSSCRPGTPIREAVRPTSPYEQYTQSLRDAGLEQTALGREWLEAGVRALQNPLTIALPFHETGYLPPNEPAAIAYRVELRRGQRLTIQIQIDSADPTRLFVDAFELPADSPPERIAYAEASASSLTVDPPRDGMYVVRLQPEMLRGGRYEIVQRITASLEFPVEGFDSRAVASHFGAPRDGGVRDHHGIDVFAPRGTPVLSAADGWVSGVQTTPRGGRVVWVWSAGRSLYYAHLDEQLVSLGQRVRAGDRLGTVGNTGNAQGAPPHLHFGIYARGEGPLDPLPFVHEPRTVPPPVTADGDPLGTWQRTKSTGFRLRAGSATTAAILMELPRHTVLRLEAATANWYRVALPDGTRGFVIARATQPLDSPIRRHSPRTATLVRQRPAPTATPIDDIEPGARVPVLGEYENYLLIRTPEGREGWVGPAAMPPAPPNQSPSEGLRPAALHPRVS